MNTPISFELAKLLKEKGFEYQYQWNPVIDNLPTITEAVMWLYEKYGIWIGVSPVFEYNDGREDYLNLQGFQYYITVITDNKYNEDKTHADRGNKNSPTEAYSAAIEYTLKNLI